MVRPTLHVYPARQPVEPRPAATLLWLRATAAGPEVLLTRRSPTASFLPGVFVFPGGRIDDEDACAHDLVHGGEGAAPAQLTAALAALRESFEELGVLHARHANGRPLAAASPCTRSCASAASAWPPPKCARSRAGPPTVTWARAASAPPF